MDINTTYPSDNYTIHVGGNILQEKIADYAKASNSIFYIIDEHVYDVHQNNLSFIDSPILIPGGEASKTASNYIETVETLLEKGIRRNSLIFVIGGGAAGDVGGFSAATVLRGVDYIQVPTTLLAHDSAIGGKTAINSIHGKNLIGAFHRPKAVIYDLELLKTLPESEILSGFGEVFKHTLLSGQKEAYRLIEETSSGIHIDALEKYIIQGIEIKKDIVTRDEHESGARKYLNLGHTLAHALEYKYKFPHGQAVMLGLYAMMTISNKYYEAKIFDLPHYFEYFQQVGYPFHYLKEMNIEEMMTLMQQDKKNQQRDYIGFILMDKNDSPQFLEIEETKIRQYLEELKESI
jgi:3-dehydroquinate synthase